jgi:hypothetical protein
MIVSVNPFQKLNIYDSSLMRQYSQAVSLNDLPPHLFATAQQAFSNLTTNEEYAIWILFVLDFVCSGFCLLLCCVCLFAFCSPSRIRYFRD